MPKQANKQKQKTSKREKKDGEGIVWEERGRKNSKRKREIGVRKGKEEEGRTGSTKVLTFL